MIASTRLRKGTVNSARGAPRLAADALAAVTRCGAPQPRLCVTKVVHINAATGSPDPVSETPWLQALAAAAVAFVGHVVGVRTMRHSI